MKKHRIFIAINLPEGIRKKLLSYREKWPELPVRWARPENLHITLAFLGLRSDSELLGICRAAESAVSETPPFTISLSKLIYGPPNKKLPGMIWVIGEKSPEFSILRNSLEKSLATSSRVNFSPEHRVFSPHITLGRIRIWEFRRVDPEERPDVEEEISLSFSVNSIEVMESRLRRGGPEYIVLESYPLKI